jgi:inner membrane protein
VDNLTHSLIGAAFARVLPKRLQRPEIYWASIIGNNFPDADFLLRFWPGSTSLDYLVHHRGYTHTFLFAPVLGLLTATIAKKATRAPRWSANLFWVATAACFLHIGADSLNSYGVHPLTPFWNRWFFGDAVYIVEPLIWFALLPLIAREAERPWARIGWGMVGIAMLALIWIFPTFSSAHSLFLSFFFFSTLALVYGTRTEPLRRSVAGGLFLSVLAVFFIGSHRAQAILREEWTKATVGERLLDVAANSTPGNPFCWSLWVSSRDAENFVFRAAGVSLWPSLIPAETCDLISASGRTAVLRAVPFASDARIRWEVEGRLSVEEWRTLRARSCTFRRLLSFARFPFVKAQPDGTLVAGDHRYDRQKGLGFAEVVLPGDEKCPTPTEADLREAPWEFPLREDGAN